MLTIRLSFRPRFSFALNPTKPLPKTYNTHIFDRSLAHHKLWCFWTGTSYARAREISPDEFRWVYLLAHLLKDSDIERARALAQRASDLRPDYAAAHVLTADLHQQKNELEKAFQHYGEAARYDSDSAAAEFGLGRHLLARGELDSALRHLERAAVLQPNAAPVHAILAKAYRRAGRREVAVKAARRAAEVDGKVGTNDPVLFEMMEEAVSALVLFNRAIAAEDAGHDEEAERLYERCLEIRPRDADIHQRLGDLLIRQGRIQPARQHYLTALEIYPERVEALSGLGKVLTHEKKFDEAADTYRRALKIRPRHIASLNNWGSILALQGNFEAAVGKYEEALELDPRNFEAHLRLGALLTEHGNFAEAVIHLRAALESQSDERPEPHVHLAFALAFSGDFHGAWNHVKTARRLGEIFPATFIEELRQKMPEPDG